MAAALGLKVGWNEGPARAEQRRANDGQRYDDHHRQETKRQAHQSDAETAQIGLALGADIEQAGMEGDGKSEAGEDEIRRIEQRVA